MLLDVSFAVIRNFINLRSIKIEIRKNFRKIKETLILTEVVVSGYNVSMLICFSDKIFAGRAALGQSIKI